MAIPEQYNGDFMAWINDVFSTTLGYTTEWMVFLKYWNNFTTQQKTQIKNIVVGALNTHIASCQDIIAEIQGR